MSLFTRFDRYSHTLRHIPLSQWWYRGRRLVRHRYWRLTKAEIHHPKQVHINALTPLFLKTEPNAIPANLLNQIQEQCQIAEEASKQHFSFLNRAKTFSGSIDWHIDTVPRLWRFNLHYFHLVPALLIQANQGQSNQAQETFTRLAISWIKGNRALRGDGWHPYTLSLRIVNWCHAIQGGLVKAEAIELVHKSLFAQARFLVNDLEHDVRGNHLLENVRALIFAGTLFSGPEAAAWLATGLDILKKETAEQVLPDGGHFERCPSYHWVVAKNYLEISLWLRRNGKAPDWLENALLRMLDFGGWITAADGREPLFKDSAWSASPDPFEVSAAGALYFQESRYKLTSNRSLYTLMLFGTAGHDQLMAMAQAPFPSGSRYFPESGYLVQRTADSFFILDVGYVCPDYLPAHAHADLFTYELHVKGQRIVVDSGVYEYQAGPWREYFRSTAAHNTVEVAQQNQSEVWGSFRVARRARPKIHHLEQTDRYTLIQASHDGYKRLSNPAIHRRTCLIHDSGFWLFVDEILGAGETDSRNFIHFHPDTHLATQAESAWQVTVPNHVNLYWADSNINQSNNKQIKGQTTPKQGWHSEMFGEVRENNVLQFEITSALPHHMAYLFTTTQSSIDKFSLDRTTEEIVVTMQHTSQPSLKLHIPINNPPFIAV